VPTRHRQTFTQALRASALSKAAALRHLWQRWLPNPTPGAWAPSPVTAFSQELKSDCLDGVVFKPPSRLRLPGAGASVRAPPAARGHRQNVLTHASPPQRAWHVAERCIDLAWISAASRRPQEPMALLGEPENDECVEKHGQQGSPFDCLAAPALPCLEAEALLAVAACDFHAPAHRAPADHLLGRCYVTRRIEGLLAWPTFQSSAGDQPERAVRHGEHAGNLIGDATTVRPTVDRERDVTASPFEYVRGAGQPRPRTCVACCACPAASQARSARRRHCRP